MSLIDSLLIEMTIEEKIGQLNLVTAGQAVTGRVLGGGMSENIRAGGIGGVFNLWGREAVAAVQKLAVESRLERSVIARRATSNDNSISACVETSTGATRRKGSSNKPRFCFSVRTRCAASSMSF
jgi:hypothetical protein